MLLRIGIDVINSLTILELEVLKYIDNNKAEVQKMSIQELSEKSFSSTATIIRLCKKIGLSGYSELKHFIKDTKDKQDKPIKESLFKDILNDNVNEIINLQQSLKEEDIMKVVSYLKSDMRVSFFGKGLTSTILDYASKQLMTNNRSNFNYQDTHIAYLAAENMSENDLLILCSVSGFTHQVVRMAQIAKIKRAKIVTITKKLGNQLSKFGDINFCTGGNEEDSHNIFDISSRIPILFILNLIITIYSKSK